MKDDGYPERLLYLCGKNKPGSDWVYEAQNKLVYLRMAYKSDHRSALSSPILAVQLQHLYGAPWRWIGETVKITVWLILSQMLFISSNAVAVTHASAERPDGFHNGCLNKFRGDWCKIFLISKTTGILVHQKPGTSWTATQIGPRCPLSRCYVIGTWNHYHSVRLWLLGDVVQIYEQKIPTHSTPFPWSWSKLFDWNFPNFHVS